MTKIKRFQQEVLRYWRKSGRHELPWRKTKDPYRILISEVMLQQTQVSRVISKYKEFLNEFPAVKALAKAQLVDVLRLWSGLGYNRRAKYLHDSAIAIMQNYSGKFPKTYQELRTLSGIGDYTAKAVRVFAFNEPEVLIETNVRTAFFQYFSYSSVLQKTALRDLDILPVAEAAARGMDPREWHSALMDYGAHLKKSGVRLNAKSAHYTKQSKFEGSLRQVRGAILRVHATGGRIEDIRGQYSSEMFESAFASLVSDGLLSERKKIVLA